MKYGWDIVQKVPIGAFFTKLLYVTQLGPNLKNVTICKPQTLNDGGEDSVKYKNRKKHRFLAAAILLFIDKIVITWKPPWVIWKFFVLM